MTTFLYVDDQAALSRVCRQLQGADAIAVDTEFIRERTYYPQLCLIQVATEHVVACIDPLSVSSLEPLLEMLYDTAVTKIFHAARQDLEIFFHQTGDVPSPVFDTQIAAGMLGFADQAGYAAVVGEMLGVLLDKAHARTNWARRPLPPAALHYAADDVRYLMQLYPVLLERLDARGRLAWANAECDPLSDAATYRPDPALAWRRIRGVNRLKPGELARLAALAAWRETQAMKSDKPRQWIVRDPLLVDIARSAPESMTELVTVRGVDERLARQHGNALLATLADAATAPAPVTARAAARRLEPDEEATVDVLMAILRRLGPAQEINTVSLASRKDLERLVLGERDLPILRGWRLEAAGRTLLDVLEGRATVQMRNGMPTVQRRRVDQSSG